MCCVHARRSALTHIYTTPIHLGQQLPATPPPSSSRNNTPHVVGASMGGPKKPELVSLKISAWSLKVGLLRKGAPW